MRKSAPISFKENKFSKADRSKRKQEGDRKEKASPTRTVSQLRNTIDWQTAILLIIRNRTETIAEV